MISKFFIYFAIVPLISYYTEAKAINGSADMFEAEFQKFKKSSEEPHSLKQNLTMKENLTTVQNNTMRTQRQVADQIIREADAIRTIIQQTIDAAIYAADPSQVSSSRKLASTKSRISGSSPDRSSYIANLLAPWLPTTQPPPQDSTFTEKFRKLWLNFLENSKQLWTAMPSAENPKESSLLQEFQKLWLQFLETSRKLLD